LFIILYRSYGAFLGLKPEGRCWLVRHGGLVCHISLKSHGNHLPKKIDLRVFSLAICVKKECKKKPG
jgi:hypothetical protein